MKTTLFYFIAIFVVGMIASAFIETPETRPAEIVYQSSIDTIDGMKVLLLEQETIKQDIHKSQENIAKKIEAVQSIEGRILGERNGFIEAAVETDSTYEVKIYPKSVLE